MSLNELAKRTSLSSNTKKNGQYKTTADMNSAYNQTTLNGKSRRIAKFIIGRQQYEFYRVFFEISTGSAAFSAFLSIDF